MSDKDLNVAVREAVYLKLTHGLADPYEPYNVVNVAYRPTRAAISIPAVTFYDSVSSGDDLVPLWDFRVEVSIWDGDLDRAEAIAHKVNKLLNLQPLPLPGDEGSVQYLKKIAGQDLPQDDADLVRKNLTYRLMAYEFNDAQPFGEA